MTPREYLAGLEFHGIKLGLDNITTLLDRAGNPQDHYPVVHVAGTNGKGSVLAFLDAMLRAAGYRTGRFTSPHLLDVRERFLVSGTPISDADLDRQITQFKEIAESSGVPVTYFEMVTAIAFQHFRDASIDAGLIEVGMGGRYDATNVVHPAVTSIMPIDFDHMQYLGHTLKSIAGEKAGILKRGIPVVIGETKPEALSVLLRQADAIGAPAVAVNEDFRFDAGGGGRPFRYESDAYEIEAEALGLAGAHQALNAAVATALAESIGDRFPRLNGDTIRTGLREACWPCRLERVLKSPVVIVDSAHNPAALEAIADSVSGSVVVLAVSTDKDAEAMVRVAERIADRLVLTEFEGARAMPAKKLSKCVSSTPCDVVVDLEAAVDRAVERAGSDGTVLITGSIFAAGQARGYLIERYGAPPLRF